MSGYTLTKTRFKEGVWEGLITAVASDAPTPEVAVSLDGKAVGAVRVSALGAAGQWLLEIPVPVEAIGDGVQTILVTDANADVTLGAFTMIAGDALAEDIRAEIELLRAELDMLKRAFRRHCLETG
ncbi:hypothetical protein [Roseivivax sp. THAF197b]|uniref:hypothetical protein n=1 Tax=Roseivivax sp. THAF197b TaxID=2588299 RepID=UPI00126971D5|nr:hypothetical protein [Roseivivax sp. THAF197b]QFS84440.1 hypothetical protein FIV09_16505 [Roseivivax sp. THAF197b]